jgi:hypothetical protein
MSTYRIAQINIARAVADIDTAIMSGFVNRLVEINAQADQARGFVWRLQSETGDATSIRLFDDDKLIVNMSVWETVEDLRHFVYKTSHVELIRDREAWFSKPTEAHQALWWVKAGQLPLPEEGRDRLLQLRREGPSPLVFTMAKPFPMPL